MNTKVSTEKNKVDIVEVSENDKVNKIEVTLKTDHKIDSKGDTTKRLEVVKDIELDDNVKLK